jgi:nucleoside phosphorylase
MPAYEPVDVAILTIIPPELRAAQDALGRLQRVKEGPHDTIFWHGAVRSALRQCDYSVALAAIGSAGTASAAALATQMIERYRPSVVLLVGIAAGMRGKVRIGEVVLSERVVAYELAALTVGKDGAPAVEHRPEVTRIHHGIQQDVLNYQPGSQRLAELFARIQGVFPEAPRGKKKEWREQVVSTVSCKSQVTIASGDKLLKDPGKLLQVRRDIHGKVEVGEMEAAGLVEACRLRGVPWLVIRGISDFGDELKDDRFHELASRTAAVVMADFLAHGLDLGEQRARVAQARPEGKSPFVLLPILRDQDFFGRRQEQGEIQDAIDKMLPVQLLGGAMVGKSSLLRWVERHVHKGQPVAWIDPGAGLSPVTLVAEMARKLGRSEVAARLNEEGATLEFALEQLRQLLPFVLLIDGADKLATAGQGFSERFFQEIRGHVEARRLTWVSAARRNLYDVFREKGLMSSFLNSSAKVWLGPLDRDAARELAALAGPAHVDWMYREAGGFAYGLQWLGDQLLRGTDDVDEMGDAFRLEMKRTFSSWCEGLSPEERALLKDCAQPEGRSSKEDRSLRQRLNHLKNRKFLMTDGGRFRLIQGEAWREFVIHEC